MPQDANNERVLYRFRALFADVTVRTSRPQGESEEDEEGIDFEAPVRMFEDLEMQ
jgi:hypothetical protein